MGIVLTGMLAVLIATPGMTQTQTQGQTQPSSATPAPAKDAPKICKRTEQTGSRMAPKRVCHTASEWQEIDSANARSVDGATSLRNSQQN